MHSGLMLTASARSSFFPAGANHSAMAANMNLPTLEDIAACTNQVLVMQMVETIADTIHYCPERAVELRHLHLEAINRATTLQSITANTLAAIRARLRAAELRQRLPFIAELSDDNTYKEWTDQLIEMMEVQYEKIIKECNSLLANGWKELLYQVCDAMRAQTYANNVEPSRRRVRCCHAVVINGDFQRGKSTVEALLALIVFCIHNDPKVGDNCCTLIVSQLRAWAMALKDTMATKATRRSPQQMQQAGGALVEEPREEGDTDDEGEIDPNELVPEQNAVVVGDLENLPLAHLAGRGARSLIENCLRRGGAMVGFRTGPQYKAFGQMIAEINDSKGCNDKAVVGVVVLDEADKMFGDSRAQHSLQLMHLLGMDSSHQANQPVLVFSVSATNIGPCYWFWRRMHQLNSNNRVKIKLDDIVGFRPADALTYRSNTVPVLGAGEILQVPKPDNEYTTEQIVDQWYDACNTPYSCILDTATTRVNMGVAHNMLDHVDAICAAMEEKHNEVHRGDDEAERPPLVPMVVIYLHGGHTTHQGMIGLQFINEQHEENRLLQKLKQSMCELAKEELAHANFLEASDQTEMQISRELGKALKKEADDLDANFNEKSDCLEVHYLTVMAWAIKRKALRLGYYTERTIQGMIDDFPSDLFFDRDHGRRSFWSTKNLQLAIFIVRKYIGEAVPIAVVGGAMVRRSMSVVAVDVMRPPISVEMDGAAFDVRDAKGVQVYVGQPKCLALVTHSVHTRLANSADGSQQKCRDRSTLTNWNVAHPELKETLDLVLEDLTVATQGFVKFNALAEFQRNRSSRVKMMDAIAGATRGPNCEDTIKAFRDELDTDDQRGWFDNLEQQLITCEDAGDEITDKQAMLALACSLALLVELPEETIQLLQRHRNPMFQRGAGEPERDIGNLHASLRRILMCQEPLRFRHALQRGRGGRNRGSNGPVPLSGLQLMALQMMAARGWRAVDANNECPDNVPEAWDIFWALRTKYPNLVAANGKDGIPGATGLGVVGGGNSCGLGLVMRQLVNRGDVYSVQALHTRPNPPLGTHGAKPNPPNVRPRLVKVYWLLHAPVVSNEVADLAL